MLGGVCVQVPVFVVPDDGSRCELVQKLKEGVFRDFPRWLAQSGAKGRRLTVPLVFCSSLVDTMVRSSLPLKFPRRVAWKIQQTAMGRFDLRLRNS